MLFMLNIDDLIIIYIIFIYRIYKQLICVSCYPITNWVVFQFVIFDMSNTIEYLLYIDTIREYELPLLILSIFVEGASLKS